MIPPTIALDDHYKGDAWEGMSIGPIVEDIDGTSTPPASACVSCRLQFREKRNKNLGYTFQSGTAVPGTGTITITSASLYTFDIPEQVLPLPAGDWVWDFETTDAAGLPITWVQGTMRVVQDKSYG